jgi:hypothetical protein
MFSVAALVRKRVGAPAFWRMRLQMPKSQSRPPDLFLADHATVKVLWAVAVVV